MSQQGYSQATLNRIKWISISVIMVFVIVVAFVCWYLTADYLRYGDYSEYPCEYSKTSAHCDKPAIMVMRYGTTSYYCEDHAEVGEEIWARIHDTYTTPRPANKDDGDDEYYPARSCPVCGTGYRANSNGALMIAKHGYCKSICGKRLNGD